MSSKNTHEILVKHVTQTHNDGSETTIVVKGMSSEEVLDLYRTIKEEIKNEST